MLERNFCLHVQKFELIWLLIVCVADWLHAVFFRFVSPLAAFFMICKQNFEAKFTAYITDF